VRANDQDLALTVRIRDLNRRFGGLQVQVSPRLRFACCRRRYRLGGASCSCHSDVDSDDELDAAPSVTAAGRWAASCRQLGLKTRMPPRRASLPVSSERLGPESGLVMLCHSLLLAASRRLPVSPTSSSSFCSTAAAAGNRKGPWFYLKAACHPPPNSAALWQERWSPVCVTVHTKNVP
jgi:hypothetical protein